MTRIRHKNTALSLQDLHQGFSTSLEQAESLLRETIILYRQRKYAGAYTRLVLGFEELGKNRLMLYQAGAVWRGQPVPWTEFWRAFYSHREKIGFALHYGLVVSEIPLKTSDDAREWLERLSEGAADLDQQKQHGQYTDYVGACFSKPNDPDFRDDCRGLVRLLRGLLSLIRRGFQGTGSLHDFERIVEAKCQLAEALGYFAVESGEEFLRAWTDSHRHIMSLDGQLPPDETVLHRITERYTEIPSRIPTTLAHLNQRPEFRAFYADMHARTGYPEWVFLGVIYNITMNERFRDTTFESVASKALAMCEWRESPSDDPLPIALYVDNDRFETMLDVWIAAFLGALGVSVDVDATRDLRQIRRAAHHQFGVLSRDVEHATAFHFSNLGEGGPASAA